MRNTGKATPAGAPLLPGCEESSPGALLAPLLEPLEGTWAMLLSTRKRDGTLVATPVNVVVDGDRAYFSTPASAGKVKRLRNFPEVEVAACNLRGRPTGVTLHAVARLLAGDEAAAARGRLVDEYPLVHRLLVPLELRLKRTYDVLYELSGWSLREDARVDPTRRSA